MAKTGRDKNTKNKAKHAKLMAQKKNKKKAKTTISAKKKKKAIKKTSTRKKSTSKKRPTVAIYKVADTIRPLTPITSLPIKKQIIDSIPEKVVLLYQCYFKVIRQRLSFSYLNSLATHRQ